MNETERILKAKIMYIASEEAATLTENGFFFVDLLRYGVNHRINRLC